MFWTLHSWQRESQLNIEKDFSCNGGWEVNEMISEAGNTHLLHYRAVSLREVALLFVPIGHGVSNFDDAGASRLKDGVQAVDDPHPAGLVGTAAADVHRLGHDAAEVFFTPAARVSEALGEYHWGHLDLFSH